MTPPHFTRHGVTVHHGDCLDVMAAMDADSVDAVVCDPPYGIAFMGKTWDSSGSFVERPANRRTNFDRVAGNHNPSNPQDAARTRAVQGVNFAAWCQQWASEALRVVKPGGHLIAFGATRTHHRLMQGVEDAGWEIRDCGVWLYRSGFPKSLDVSKAIDRAAGAEREVVGPSIHYSANRETTIGGRGVYNGGAPGGGTITTPATPEAEQWNGWGTALKPAIEPWVLARKPFTGTVAANVLEHGTGAINVDGCRAPFAGDKWEPHTATGLAKVKYFTDGEAAEIDKAAHDAGRWPANVATIDADPDWRHFLVRDVPKAASSEKPWGGHVAAAARICTRCGRQDLSGSRCECDDPQWTRGSDGDAELHPTVKPLALMRHLVRLVTPPGGTVLDPFGGTGTTGEAAIIEGFNAVLIEREAAYLPLIERRLSKPIQAGLL